MVALAQGLLQPGHVGQIAQMRHRLKPRQKLGKAFAIQHQPPIRWRCLAQVNQRHGGKERRPHQLLHGGKGRLQHADQRAVDRVAIDREPLGIGQAIGADKARGHGVRGVQKCGGKLSLAHLGTRSSVARAASAARTGQSGTSLSHSISVGRGPASVMTWA